MDGSLAGTHHDCPLRHIFPRLTGGISSPHSASRFMFLSTFSVSYTTSESPGSQEIIWSLPPREEGLEHVKIVG